MLKETKRSPKIDLKWNKTFIQAIQGHWVITDKHFLFVQSVQAYCANICASILWNDTHQLSWRTYPCHQTKDQFKPQRQTAVSVIVVISNLVYNLEMICHYKRNTCVHKHTSVTTLLNLSDFNKSDALKPVASLIQRSDEINIF